MATDDTTLLLADGRYPAPEEESAPLSVAYRKGELIGDKYELCGLLGEGGMGVVWLARNRALDSDVAIKLLRAGPRSATLERRMLKEAQAAARLGHPAILRVFDFGTTHRGDPYMVMEVLDGEDLGRTLERNGRLSPIKAVRTILPVLHALGAAHQKAIIHRDLKPENIFLTTTDGGYVQPKLVDFGIVKTSEPELDRLTRVGAVIGTPAYLSPEQARGEDVDRRVDVWSAAVVLYEMVTCRLPFEAGNYNSLMRAIIEDAPPPLSTFGIDAEPLWAILERGLAKRADARWPSMAAFGGALASWLLAQGETDDISGTSLRAAWQQGPGAAHPDDLYSARPHRTLDHLPKAAGLAALHGGSRWRLPWLALGLALSGSALYAALLLVPPPAEPRRALTVQPVAEPPAAELSAAPPSATGPAAAPRAEASPPLAAAELSPTLPVRSDHPATGQPQRTTTPSAPTRKAARVRSTTVKAGAAATDDLKTLL